MRTIITAVLLMSFVAAAEAQNSPDGEMACKADRTGRLLLTKAEYQNGYVVEAPWRVVATRSVQSGAARLTATLDHIVETDPISGKRKRTALPGTIEMTFNGPNTNSMLRNAADVWCATVSKALAARPAETTSRVAQGRVII
jgi:hypothetical protein